MATGMKATRGSAALSGSGGASRPGGVEKDPPKLRLKPWAAKLLSPSPSDIATMLGVFGVAAFCALFIGYGRFYGGLGVSLTDVGLNYSGVLESCAGFVSAGAAIGAVQALLSLALRGHYRPQLGDDSTLRILTRPSLMFIGGSMLWTLGLLFIVFPLVATQAKSDVKAGNPVLPLRQLVTGIPLSAIKAEPVSIAAIGEPGKDPAIEALASRDLLYLGQANGFAVVYDSHAQASMKVPLASALLTVSNCQRPYTDHRCDKVFGRRPAVPSATPR